jgi:flagellar biosynthesis chaperone FliJ
MNNNRRKMIDEAIKELEAAKDKLENAKGLIETIRDEEEEYKDNMPESLQGGDKYANAEAAVDVLNEVGEALDFDVDDLISKLEEAKA